MKEEQINSSGEGLGRRDFMKKVGTSVNRAALGDKSLSVEVAQESAPQAPAKFSIPPTEIVRSGTGWKNDANRISGNGPIDDTTRQILSYVNSLNESHLTEPLVTGLNDIFIDAIAATMSGFESEPARISARLAKETECDLKSTVFGYGVTSSPELAAFANTNMVRHTDFNDIEPPAGSHSSVMIPGILAIGEAIHSTGPQVMIATAMAYEVLSALGRATSSHKISLDGPYEGVGTALACAKLMGLNDDKMANALSLSLVPHLPMFVSHVGALSMWKGCHSGMGVRGGVFAAIMAREGMTGPSRPFEGRGGLWDTIGVSNSELHLPVSSNGKMVVETFGFKRFPAEGSTQSMLDQFVPKVRAWTKIEDIASVRIEEPFSANQETGVFPKWDPRNRETADHSYAFVTAIGLIDGDVYIQSFKPERYLEDQKVRHLMEKITIRANTEFENPRKRITVRKKSGEELVVDLMEIRPMSHGEIVAKFNRIFDYMSVSKDQRDRALASWSNLRGVKDIAVPVRDLASFGKPQPL